MPLALALAAAVPQMTAPASAATTTITPTADTYLDAGRPATNYGSAKSLHLLASPTKKALFKFQAPAPGTVTGLVLRVYNGSSVTSGEIAVKKVLTERWTETGTTYNTQPSFSSKIAVRTNPPTGWVDIKLPVSILNASGTTSIGLDRGNDSTLSVRSRESTTPPKLLVTTADATPAPAPAPATQPAPAPGTSGAQLYVSATGSDANACTSTAPCRQLTRANALAKPGTTVNVAPGTYTGGRLTTAGSSTGPIRYVSTSKWGAKILGMVTTGAYVDVEGFDMTLPTGDANNAIVWLQGSYSRAIGNLVHDLKLGCTSAGSNGGSGINASGPNYETHHQEILGNVVRDMGTGPRDGTCRLVHGIYAAQPDVKVVNNLVYRSIGDGISSWHGATRLTIVNNTSVANGGSGITIGAGDGGTTAEGHRDSFVANNVVTGNAINGVGESGSPNGQNVYRNNVSFGNRNNALNIGGTSVQSGTAVADPLYVNAGTDDFRLQSGSPAVDTGTSERAPATDIAGAARAQGAGFDRGAYER